VTENDLAHTFDVSDLDDARDTAPVAKIEDSTSAASLSGNSAGAARVHGAAEVAFTVADPPPTRGGELFVTIMRSGKPVTVTLQIADDESDESIATRVAAAINRTKDEILW
jgi:hypothetical protein